MAKQTFTTGQVLTAAQMTSLQQTAMGGGAATAKTTSYVLTAADAGTVVQMNAAGATTITVNTALFAAGDTVQIQNVGAGVCTVTAGTATVSTSATLALKQYDAGSLYFNSTSAAIFFATDAADSTSPLTTKGDLYGFSTLDARIPIGTNNQVLTADSTQALGLKWATPAGGGKVLQVLSKAINTFQSINSSTYVDLTDFTLSITPSATTSKVLIFISVAGWDAQSQTVANPCRISLRNGSNTVLNTPYDWYAPVDNSVTYPKATPGLISQSYLDSPATTSAVTYKVSALNTSAPGSGFFMNNGATSSMTIMEIGA